jgi:hypothetical protein
MPAASKFLAESFHIFPQAIAKGAFPDKRRKTCRSQSSCLAAGLLHPPIPAFMGIRSGALEIFPSPFHAIQAQPQAKSSIDFGREPPFITHITRSDYQNHRITDRIRNSAGERERPK